MDRKTQLKSQFQEVLNEINSYKSTAKDIHLVAVTKYSPFSDIELSYEVGHRDFGENRVSELLEKANLAMDKGLKNIRWHFIGHLQSNKMAKLLTVPNLNFIHSIHSKKLLELLHAKSEGIDHAPIGYFLQVNTSFEDEKSGFETYDELMEAVNFCLQKENDKLKLIGLMTMGKIRTDDVRGSAKECFSGLVNFKKQLEEDFSVNLMLSMGMSSDYDIAINLGSDFIRVGSKIYKD